MWPVRGRLVGLQGNGRGQRCEKAPQREDGRDFLRDGQKGCVAGMPGGQGSGAATADAHSGPQRASKGCGCLSEEPESIGGLGRELAELEPHFKKDSSGCVEDGLR